MTDQPTEATQPVPEAVVPPTDQERAVAWLLPDDKVRADQFRAGQRLLQELAQPADRGH